MKPLNLGSYLILAKIGIYLITGVVYFQGLYEKILKVENILAQIHS